jgi:hypothetical protein
VRNGCASLTTSRDTRFVGEPSGSRDEGPGYYRSTDKSMDRAADSGGRDSVDAARRMPKFAAAASSGTGTQHKRAMSSEHVECR